MEDILSVIAIALLLIVLVASLRKQHVKEADERAHAQPRLGSDGAQEERSMQRREAARAAARDE